jgi:hypothetical protein
MKLLCPIPTRLMKSFGEAMIHYRELLLAGKEGSVLKNGTGNLKDTGSSGHKEVIKLQLEIMPVYLKVTAIVPGRVATKNEGRAGSLMMESSDGQLRVDVTVKNEKLRALSDANHDDNIGRVWKVIFNDIMEACEKQ